MPKANKPEVKTKAEVAEALPTVEELEAQLAFLQKKEAELAKELAVDRRPPVPDSTPLPSDDRLASEATEEEIARAEVLRDPYDAKITTRIHRHPPGKILNWLNPRIVERRGTMKGYTPVKKDDAIGREIHRYIDTPPERMSGLAGVDSYIRRGDLILCFIDKGVYDKRQLAREQEASRRIGGQATQQTFKSKDGLVTGRTTDDGLVADKHPYAERRKQLTGMVDPKGPEEYQAEARGTVQDNAIAVSRGRPMFEEMNDEE